MCQIPNIAYIQMLGLRLWFWPWGKRMKNRKRRKKGELSRRWLCLVVTSLAGEQSHSQSISLWSYINYLFTDSLSPDAIKLHKWKYIKINSLTLRKWVIRRKRTSDIPRFKRNNSKSTPFSFYLRKKSPRNVIF